MKFKTLTMISTTALLSAAILPASYAQDVSETVYVRPIPSVAAVMPSAFLLAAQTERSRPGVRSGDGFAGGEGAGPRSRGRGRPGGNAERILDRLDTDADGEISENEFVDVRLDRSDENFDRLDADGDGLISREEIERPDRPDRPEIDRAAVIACVRETIADYDGTPDLEDRFDNVDLNDDGFIDLFELSTAAEERAYVLFDRIDTNGDGFISLEELEESQEKELNLRRVIHDCIQEQLDPFEADIV